MLAAPRGGSSRALEGLDLLGPGDAPRFRGAVEAGEYTGFGYFFPHLLAQPREGRCVMLVGEAEGSLAVYRWRIREGRPHLDLYLPPLPSGAAAVKRALERANDFNGDRSARILRIDDRDAPSLAALGGLRVEPRRRQYLYRPADYESLAGNRLRTLRRHVALVEPRADVVVEPFVAAHADPCRELLRRWHERHRAIHGTEGGVVTARRAIDLATILPEGELGGEVIFVEGRVSAFAFGGPIRPGLGCAFEAKADESVPGLAYFQRRSFLLRLRDFDRVNDGSDAGREGLRQLKDSLRPIGFHAEHRATQRR